MRNYRLFYYYCVNLVPLLALVSLPFIWGCGENVDVEDPPDFYVTVQLAPNFEPLAVDNLIVTATNTSVLLDDSEGELFDGGIQWLTRTDARGDELVITVTGDYVYAHSIPQVGGHTDLDIPFVGGLGGEETSFRFEAVAEWADHRDALHRIGFGTQSMDFPVVPQTSITIEVACLTPDWGWTCETGCAPEAQQCPNGIEQCGDGSYECINECCVPVE